MPALTDLLSPDPSTTLQSIRILKATPEQVFSAWTEAEHLKNWWGPDGFSNTFHEFDPRPGGHWKFTMHGPDGKDYLNESVFLLIEENARIVFNHIVPPFFQLQAGFEAAGPGLTRISFTQIFENAETLDKIRDFIGNKNEENLDRLEAELARMMK
jgi:uncharacterized protein YndB with AHSA1/START domain